MRKHRYALAITIAFVFAVVLLSSVVGTKSSATSATPQEKCSPCVSSQTRHSLTIRYATTAFAFAPRLLPPPPTPIPPQVADVAVIQTTQHARLAAFAQAVNTYRLVSYTTAVVAAQESEARAARAASYASEERTASTSQSSTTTQDSAASGDSNASIWSCIEEHESHFEPTAYNSSSGAAGLFQFELGTWLSSSIISITGQYRGGAATAPASVQWAAAISYEAQNGWSAWRGDGCTPDG